MDQASAAFSGFHVAGADTARFLQGQLSCDVQALRPGDATLAGLHNPQGRVIAVLYLRCQAADRFSACLPADLTDIVINHLRRFVLRAKLVVTRDDAIALPEPLQSALGRIARGVPMVYAATSKHFVAQMLNLDTLGAVSFSKGCYTGQEIIARAHYRGRVKRRMQRFTLSSGDVPVPGAALALTDGRHGEVVEAARDTDGSIAVLAVTATNATPE